MLTSLSQDVLAMIGDDLSLQNVRSLRLVCKYFRDTFRHDVLVRKRRKIVHRWRIAATGIQTDVLFFLLLITSKNTETVNDVIWKVDLADGINDITSVVKRHLSLMSSTHLKKVRSCLIDAAREWTKAPFITSLEPIVYFDMTNIRSHLHTASTAAQYVASSFQEPYIKICMKHLFSAHTGFIKRMRRICMPLFLSHLTNTAVRPFEMSFTLQVFCIFCDVRN